MTTIILLALVLFLATLAGGRSVASAHSYRPAECGARCHALKHRMWTWYRTSGFKCIREHEASWHDGGAPYWGGIQADMSFQWAYGRGLGGASYVTRWGTADHWPHFRQIHAAFRGYQARGWWPWEYTARVKCGLL